MSNKLLTAKDFLNNYKFKAGKRIGNSDFDTMAQFARDFAKMHVIAAIEAIISNTGFEETTTEELNENEYKPFITGADGTIWTIDENNMELAYPLENIK